MVELPGTQRKKLHADATSLYTAKPRTGAVWVKVKVLPATATVGGSSVAAAKSGTTGGRAGAA